MPTQTRYATVGSSIGGPSWINPTEGVRQGGSGSDCTMLGSASGTLQAGGFGFAIPGNALVRGIAVSIPSITAGQPAGWWTSTLTFLDLVNVGGGTTPKNPGVQAYPTLNNSAGGGGATDLWGKSLILPSAINNGAFGFQLRFTYDGGAPDPNNQAANPHVNGNTAITIYYDLISVKGLQGVGR